VPGPVLEAQQGVPLEIEFANRLPEPTVIHWHGLRIPAALDGTEVVQRPVQPGETSTYRFTPPDAGTFWYHPHASEPWQEHLGQRRGPAFLQEHQGPGGGSLPRHRRHQECRRAHTALSDAVATVPY
jgi:hypothetical protein